MSTATKLSPFIRIASAPAARLFVLTGFGSCICALLLLSITFPESAVLKLFFIYHLYTYDRPSSLIGILLLPIAAAMSPFCGRLSIVAAACGRHPWRVATLTAISFALGARYIYHAHPLSMDEYAVWFQSRIFAHGSLTGQFPAAWLNRLILYPPFQNDFLIVSKATGQVASAYWPGFALAMTPFSMIGAEWLCNPMLSALSVVVIAHTCCLVFPKEDEIAGWAVLFTVASPVFVASGISYYAMTALLLANLAFTWGFFQPTAPRLFLSGVIGSIALTLHNPVPHTLFALPWLIWFLLQRPSRRQMATLIAGYVPLILLLGVGWVLFKVHVVSNVSSQAVHPASKDFLNQVASSFAVPDLKILFTRICCTIKLWIWAVPGLLILACVGYSHRRNNVYVRLLAASAALTFLAYFFIPFDQGNGWGYRYFHSAWGVLPILAGAAMIGKFRDTDDASLRAFRNISGAFILSSLLILMPWQLKGIDEHISTQLARVPEVPATGNSIVFLFIDRSSFLGDLVQNDPFLRDRVMRMISRGKQADQEFLLSANIKAIPLPATRSGQVWLIEK